MLRRKKGCFIKKNLSAVLSVCLIFSTFTVAGSSAEAKTEPSDAVKNTFEVPVDLFRENPEETPEQQSLPAMEAAGNMETAGEIDSVNDMLLAGNAALPQPITVTAPKVSDGGIEGLPETLEFTYADFYYLYKGKSQLLLTSNIPYDTLEGEAFLSKDKTSFEDKIRLDCYRADDGFVSFYCDDVGRIGEAASSYYLQYTVNDYTGGNNRVTVYQAELKLQYRQDSDVSCVTANMVPLELKGTLNLNLKLGGQVIDGEVLNVRVENANGTTLLKADPRRQYINVRKRNEFDQRFHPVFPNVSHQFQLQSTYWELDCALAPANPLELGRHDLVLELDDGTELRFPEAVEIQDSLVIDTLFAERGEGYPSPVAGGNTAVIELGSPNADVPLEALTVSLQNRAGEEIGTTVEKRWKSADRALFWLELKEGYFFSADEAYRLSVSSSGAKPLFYSGTGSVSLAREMEIYSCTMNQPGKADFHIKAIGTQPQPVRLALTVYDDQYNTVALSQKDVRLDTECDIVFEDAAGRIIQLQNETEYGISIYDEDSWGNWHTLYYFYYYNDFLSEGSETMWMESSKAVGAGLREYAANIGFDMAYYDLSRPVIASILDENKKEIGTGTLVQDPQHLNYMEGTVKLNSGVEIIAGRQYSLKVSASTAKGETDSRIFSLTAKPAGEVYGVVSPNVFYRSKERNSGIMTGVVKCSSLSAEMPIDEKNLSFKLYTLGGEQMDTSILSLSGKQTGSYDYSYLYNFELEIKQVSPNVLYGLEVLYDGKPIYDENAPQFVYLDRSQHQKYRLCQDGAAVGSWYLRDESGYSYYDRVKIYGCTGQPVLWLYDTDQHLKEPIKINLTKGDDGVTYYLPELKQLLGLGVKTGVEYRVQVFDGVSLVDTFARTICGVRQESEKVTELKLDRRSLELNQGDSELLSVSVLPDSAAGTQIFWSSSNENVAQVKPIDGNFAKVTALTEGTCTIYAETADGTVRAACQTTVLYAGPTAEVTRISCDGQKLTCDENGEYTLTPDAYKYLKNGGEIALEVAGRRLTEDGTFGITISNSRSFSSVLTEGVFDNITEGEDTCYLSCQLPFEVETRSTAIYVRLQKDGETIGSTIPLKFQCKNENGENPPERWRIKGDEVKFIYVGETVQLEIEKSPANSSLQKLQWETEGTTVASISSGGEVTGIMPGYAYCTAVDEFGEETGCLILVYPVGANKDYPEIVIEEISVGGTAITDWKAKPGVDHDLNIYLNWNGQDAETDVVVKAHLEGLPPNLGSDPLLDKLDHFLLSIGDVLGDSLTSDAQGRSESVVLRGMAKYGDPYDPSICRDTASVPIQVDFSFVKLPDNGSGANQGSGSGGVGGGGMHLNGTRLFLAKTSEYENIQVSGRETVVLDKKTESGTEQYTLQVQTNVRNDAQETKKVSLLIAVYDDKTGQLLETKVREMELAAGQVSELLSPQFTWRREETRFTVMVLNDSGAPVCDAVKSTGSDF